MYLRPLRLCASGLAEKRTAFCGQRLHCLYRTRPDFLILPSSTHADYRYKSPEINRSLIPCASAVSQHSAPEADVPVPSICAGCGVKLQADDANAPGFYQISQKVLEYYRQLRESQAQQESQDADWGLQQQRLAMGLPVDSATTSEGEAAEEAADDLDDVMTLEEYQQIEAEMGGTWDLEEEHGGKAGQQQGQLLQERLLSGQRSSSSGRDDWQDEVSDAAVADGANLTPTDGEEKGQGPPAIVCARCYSLRHYGHVRSEVAERQNPEFALGVKVGRKIAYTRFRRAVLLCVVDVGDFDGSLPRLALQQVLEQVQRHQQQQQKEAVAAAGAEAASEAVPLGFRLVLAVNKVDLLPSTVAPARLVNWVRMRAKQGGLPSPVAVPLVSSVKGQGVSDLYTLLRELVGARGDVWVIGAQNAGKSSLINALRRCAKLPEDRQLTTAVLPGTTLGMLKVEGLLSGQGHLFDTPGVPHSYQLTARLALEEVKLVLPRARLRPRTYRIGPGQSVLLGGLARVDVVECPGATVYITVWLSGDVPCWMGKTDKASDRLVAHVGTLLYPPLPQTSDDEKRRRALELMPTKVTVSGDSWSASSTDVAVSGLGWIAVGVKGEAQLQVWAPSGVAITVRRAMLPDYAREFERPGFSQGAAKPAALQSSAENKAAAAKGSASKSPGAKAGRAKSQPGRPGKARAGAGAGAGAAAKARKPGSTATRKAVN